MGAISLTLRLFIIILIGAIGCLSNGWGFFEPYLRSYLHETSKTVTGSTMACYFFVLFIGQIIGSFTFSCMMNLQGYKEILCLSYLLCGITMCIGFFDLNYVNLIIILLINGIQETYRLIISPFILMNLMPDNLSLAASMANCGSGLATIYYNQMASTLINPSNHPPSIKENGQNFYPAAVADETPLFIFIVGQINFVCALLCLILVNPKGMENKLFHYLNCRCFQSEKKTDYLNSTETNVTNKEESLLQTHRSLKRTMGKNNSIHDGFIWTYNETQMKTFSRVSMSTTKLFDKSDKISITYIGKNGDKQNQKMLNFKYKNDYQFIVPVTNDYKQRLVQKSVGSENDIRISDIGLKHKYSQVHTPKYKGDIDSSHVDNSHVDERDCSFMNMSDIKNVLITRFDSTISGIEGITTTRFNSMHDHTLQEDHTLQYENMTDVTEEIISKKDFSFNRPKPEEQKFKNGKHMLEINSPGTPDRNMNRSGPILTNQKSPYSRENKSPVFEKAQTSVNKEDLFEKYKFPSKNEKPKDDDLFKVSEEVYLMSNGEAKTQKDVSSNSKILLTLQDLSVVPEYPEMVKQEYLNIIKSQPFWLQWISLTFLYSIPLFMNVNIKTFGLVYFTDSQLANLSLLGFTFMTLARFLSGFMMDKFGIKVVLIVVAFSNLIGSLLLMFWRDVQIIYYIAMTTFWFNNGCCSNMIGSVLSFIYGVNLAVKLAPIMNVIYVLGCLLMMFYSVVVMGNIGIDMTCLVIMVLMVLVVFISMKVNV